MAQLDILVFSAHAADFCSRSGGTLALHTKRGASVHVVDLSFGERGESEDYWARTGPKSEEECKRVRSEEAREAAGVIGASIEFLDYGDYPMVISKEQIEFIARLIRKRKPHIILTHWECEQFNMDHEVTSAVVRRAATIAAIAGFEPQVPKAPPPYMFAFEPTVPRSEATGFRPDHYVDIGEVFELKMKAMRALRSQSRLVGMYTQWAEYRGAQASATSRRPVKYAEAFQRYTATVDVGLPVPLL